MDLFVSHNRESPLIALLDCNNFYVSCERVFDPFLRDKPVIVLSNNDGCVISRSNEAKALGIPMAAPVYQYRELIRKHKIQVRSSNFVLYGDMSKRVMQTIESLVTSVEIYSIDEAFISLDGYDLQRAEKLVTQLRKRILSWTGIPVSVGVSRTKTLAKAASYRAKKNEQYNGVYVLESNDRPELYEVLKTIPVGEVWGIGRKSSAFLATRGLSSAYDLIQKSDIWVRKNLSITGLKTVWELGGTPCLGLEQVHEHSKTIISSRSFYHPVLTFSDLSGAVSGYIDRACEKLRQQNSVAHTLTLYIRTSYYNPYKPHYKNAATVTLPVASSFPPDFLQPALKALSQIFQSGFEYKKAGVVLSGIVSETAQQFSLLSAPPALEKQRSLMRAHDFLRRRFGKRSLFFAAQGLTKPWETQQLNRSPDYTTDLGQVLKVS